MSSAIAPASYLEITILIVSLGQCSCRVIERVLPPQLVLDLKNWREGLTLLNLRWPRLNGVIEVRRPSC